MCKSQAEGGQRCSAHTLAALEKATVAVNKALASGDPDRIAAADRDWEEAAVDHASTATGRKAFRSDIAALTEAGDEHNVARFQSIIRRGRERAAMHRAQREAQRQALQPEPRIKAAIDNGHYRLDPDGRTITCSPRHSCEIHDQPGSCNEGCVELIAGMSGDTGLDFDPTGTSYPEPAPYFRHGFDASKKSCVEYVVAPVECLDDDQHATVTGGTLITQS